MQSETHGAESKECATLVLTVDELWQQYLAASGKEPSTPPAAWAFGVQADELLELVLQGKKTATASPAELYEIESEPLPQQGERSIILDAAGNARCIIETTDVMVVPFSQVPAEHALLEGEGDRSIAFWRRAHEEAFVPWLAEAGISFHEETPVVLERFKLLYVSAQ